MNPEDLSVPTVQKPTFITRVFAVQLWLLLLISGLYLVRLLAFAGLFALNEIILAAPALGLSSLALIYRRSDRGRSWTFHVMALIYTMSLTGVALAYAHGLALVMLIAAFGGLIGGVWVAVVVRKKESIVPGRPSVLLIALIIASTVYTLGNVTHFTTAPISGNVQVSMSNVNNSTEQGTMIVSYSYGKLDHFVFSIRDSSISETDRPNLYYQTWLFDPKSQTYCPRPPLDYWPDNLDGPVYSMSWSFDGNGGRIDDYTDVDWTHDPCQQNSTKAVISIEELKNRESIKRLKQQPNQIILTGELDRTSSSAGLYPASF